MKSPVELLRESLSLDDDLYIMVTALRGPDFQAQCLKIIFTARMRRLVFGRACPSCVIYRTAPNIRSYYIREAEKEIKAQIDRGNDVGVFHYLKHIRYALEALREHSLIDRDEYEFLHDLLEQYLLLVSDHTAKVDYEHCRNWEKFVVEEEVHEE
ncbi:MAG: hypothetical protein ACXQS5_06715 [Candidatus Methanospirareceae archaeon]